MVRPLCFTGRLSNHSWAMGMEQWAARWAGRVFHLFLATPAVALGKAAGRRLPYLLWSWLVLLLGMVTGVAHVFLW